jgi:hypothetical protein
MSVTKKKTLAEEVGENSNFIDYGDAKCENVYSVFELFDCQISSWCLMWLYSGLLDFVSL